MKNFITIACLFFVFSCDNRKQKVVSSSITIKGDLQNLPDGKLNLVDNEFKILFTTVSKNGKFSFSLNSKDFPEPVRVGLHHFDKDSVKRNFIYNNFDSKSDSKNMVIKSQFMLEDGIVFSGNVKEFMRFAPKIMEVYPDKNPTFGIQTKVLFKHFYAPNNISVFKELIKDYPFSYHLLYELNRKRNFIKDDQVNELLDDFDDEIKANITWKNLKKHIDNRKNKKLDFTITSINQNGKNDYILNKTSSLNMVILWASWCGPCRQEIPELKKLYQEFLKRKDFSMTSISMDEDSAKWKIALSQEKMLWKQLLISEDVRQFSKEYLDYDNAIPIIIFVDKNAKIIKKFTGYDEKGGNEIKLFVLKYLGGNFS